MANENNLKPFKSGNDPRRNTTGANASSITKYLKEYGSSKRIKFHIETTDEFGLVTIDSDEIKTKGNRSVNQVIASRLLARAIKGDFKAIQEVLDRTEGKPKQGIDFQDLSNMEIEIGYYDNDE